VAFHGDADAEVLRAAAQEGRVLERGGARLAGVDPGEEGVTLPTAVVRLEGVGGNREVGRDGAARDVGVVAIERDAEARVVVVAAEVGGVFEGGVDDERPAVVVGAGCEAIAVAVAEREAALDGHAPAVQALVADRGRVLEHAALGAHLQRSG
jgi:hypothetical protein